MKLYFPREAREAREAGRLPEMVERADYDSKALVSKIPESQEKAKRMTATVGGKVSDNNPEDQSFK